MSSVVREPYVAGTFYPDDPKELLSLLEQLRSRVEPPRLPRRPRVLIVPHAGYIYSGLTAMHGYASLEPFERPDSVIIIGTKHTPYGHDYALGRYEYWRTPLGLVPENLGLLDLLVREGLLADNLAHELEHSVEVQLPFLQFIYSDDVPGIVPMVAARPDPEMAITAGDIIYSVIKNYNVLVIISSDFTHYEPHEIAKKKDSIAIQDILSKDIYKFKEDVDRLQISICGVAPIMIGMRLAQCFDLEGKLLHYSTSGDATGEYSEVVGYAAIAFY
jgi:AmmeMemoRadiSam system protein B